MLINYIIVVMKRFFKYMSFGTVAVMLLVLMTATILEKFFGTSVAVDYVYCSPWVIGLWIMLAFSAFVYLLFSGMPILSMSFVIHLSFLIILAGAFVTHVSGVQGKVHLREGAPPTTVFVLPDGELARLPFQLSLQEFRIEYYPGTHAVTDYISSIEITDKESRVTGATSMNNIFNYRSWRFYQSGYDEDEMGATLSILHDPYGITITYIGYITLIAGMVGFFFQKKSTYRKLLKRYISGRTVVLLLLLFGTVGIKAADVPPTLPRDAADAFGNIYLYYNDRICPMQTLAKDFTVKLCGKSSYKGLTAEQVLCGWLFYYDEWRQEPLIKIRDKGVCSILGIEGGYASLADFTDVNGYKLQDALKNGSDIVLRRAANSANEKYNIIGMVSSGSFLKIYPYTAQGIMQWYSLADSLPAGISDESLLFIKNSMVALADNVAMGCFDDATALLCAIREFQRDAGGESLPTEVRFNAEKIYNTANYVRPLSMVCVGLGILCFLLYCRRLVAKNPVLPKIHNLFIGVVWSVFVYLTALMAVRGYVGDYLPLSNGFETMVFMAWCSLLMTLLLNRRLFMALPFGILLCGLTLMVAMMGETNPKITHLIPVLQSPLLSIHVVVIMLSYSLLAFAMLNGVTALLLYYSGGSLRRVELLADFSRLMLYPAVFLLAIGIFVGAVWANVSWGRYWGWDPKEVWALITMLVYSLALHSASLSPFRKPLFLHLFSIIAFLTVLVTYFGVNFVLGGMHSYA